MSAASRFPLVEAPRCRVLGTLLITALLGWSCARAPVPASSPAATESECAALSGLLDFALETEVAPVQGLPTHCQVRGILDERIGYEARLPLDGWNRKLVVAGCGGFCGAVEADKEGYSNTINEALRAGYAAITTDGGHQAESWDTSWGLDDPVAVELFAGAWLPRAAGALERLAEELYDETPTRRYFSGCSNGGRLGLFAAQRYPDLFDGIAAGCGILDLSGNAGLHGLWVLQTTRTASGEPRLDRDDVALLEQTVRARCDTLDGVDDGIVARPDLCDPGIEDLVCGESSDDCLGEDALDAAVALYSGAKTNGQQLFPGLPYGSERLWPLWIAGEVDRRAWGELAAEGYLRLALGIPPDDALAIGELDLGTDRESIESLSPMLDAKTADLSAFEAAGGKLLYYHGAADPLVLPGRAQQYVDSVSEHLGTERASDFLRAFFLPGSGHCWETPGVVPDAFDPLAILDSWVASGEAPQSIEVSQVGADGIAGRGRLVCAHPLVASLRPGAAPDEASSYDCVSPH